VQQNAYNMEEKEQTAVDWLYDQMTATWFDKVSGSDILKQAKEKHEDQVRTAFVVGKWDGKDRDIDSEQYYKETFLP
jgi:hypothetical protein